MNVPAIPSLEAEPKLIAKMEALISWKQIAAYLGAGVRTAQRYECDYEMPVLRFDGRGHATVWAYPTELDTWLRCKIKEQRHSSHNSNHRLDIALSHFKVAMTRISESLAENERLRNEASRLRAEMYESVALLNTGLGTLSLPKTRATQE